MEVRAQLARLMRTCGITTRIFKSTHAVTPLVRQRWCRYCRMEVRPRATYHYNAHTAMLFTRQQQHRPVSNVISSCMRRCRSSRAVFTTEFCVNERRTCTLKRNCFYSSKMGHHSSRRCRHFVLTRDTDLPCPYRYKRRRPYMISRPRHLKSGGHKATTTAGLARLVSCPPQWMCASDRTLYLF